jgi:hypothetical protein
MPDADIGKDASFQLILNLTTSVAALQRDVDHMSAGLNALRAEIVEEKKERSEQSSEHGADINRLEWTLAGLDKLSAEELRVVRRRMEADEGSELRRMGLKWPIIVGLSISLVTIAVTVAVNLILRAAGG